MIKTNTSENQSQLVSESESLSHTEDLATIDSNENIIDVDKSTTENVNQITLKPSQEFLKNADWYGIACKIRKNNRQLVQKTMELETSLKEYQEKLEIQQRRCLSADNLIQQQTQDLHNSNEEISQLYNQLDKANQKLENQQTFMESLTQQLQVSQEQIARLERECSLLRDNYYQQKSDILQVEKYNRELEIRLQRQQHYTLQFKTALDQCLKAPLDENIEDILESTLSIKAKEIKPWSSFQEDKENISASSNLQKKLLPTKVIDMSNFSDQEALNLTENNTFLSETFADNIENSNLETNNLTSNINDFKEENNTEIQLSEEEENINLNLPLWKTKSSKQIKSYIPSAQSQSASLLLDTSPSPSVNKNKEFLKLPKFLQ